VTKLPAQNLDRARRFYRDRLGLEPVEEREGGLRYVCGTTEFHIFASSGTASGRSTQLGFEVEDIDHVVADLLARGLEFASFDLGDLEVTNQGAVAFAERPHRVKSLDAAFDRQHASGGDVPCGDFIHGMPVSLHAVDEVASEIAASRVLGLGRVPVRADPRCGGIRLQRDDPLDLGERDLQLPQGRDQPGAVEL
jgi:catechol 2,3-dioxygenase-like lactoylglutathione lyase family enzyme